MRALSSVGSRMRVSLELFFSLSALKYRMRERMRCWLEMLLGGYSTGMGADRVAGVPLEWKAVAAAWPARALSFAVFICEKSAKSETKKYCSIFHLYVVNIILL